MKSESETKPNILKKLSLIFCKLIILTLIYASVISLIPEIWRFVLTIFWFIVFLIFAYKEEKEVEKDD